MIPAAGLVQRVLGDDAGSINVIYGTATGPASPGNQVWNQAGGLDGTAQTGDHLGGALDTG